MQFSNRGTSWKLEKKSFYPSVQGAVFTAKVEEVAEGRRKNFKCRKPSLDLRGGHSMIVSYLNITSTGSHNTVKCLASFLEITITRNHTKRNLPISVNSTTKVPYFNQKSTTLSRLPEILDDILLFCFPRLCLSPMIFVELPWLPWPKDTSQISSFEVNNYNYRGLEHKFSAVLGTMLTSKDVRIITIAIIWDWSSGGSQVSYRKRPIS